MRKNRVLSTAILALSVTAVAGAQSMKTAGLSTGDMASMTYTGCVESVNHGAAFLLTRVETADGGSMHGDMAMKRHDDMAHDDMTKSDAPKAMEKRETPKADDKMDAMSPKSFVLAGSPKLRRHIGQRVSVTGSLSEGSMGTMHHDVSTLTVRTLKVIAKSCS